MRSRIRRKVNMTSRTSDSRPRLAKRVRLHIDVLSGNPVLLHQEAVIVLNRTGYDILQLCDGTRTLSEIIQNLETRYLAGESILSREVLEYILAISVKGLIEWG
jgi:pyrroloquinoline quinone biosynthesis protein D